MAQLKKRTGFVGKFMAHNVNVSAPNTHAKWSQLRQYLQRNSSELLRNYANNDDLKEAIEISNSNNTPDELFEFAKCFLGFVSSADEHALKNDSIVFDLAEQLAEVAKLSYDKRAIDMAIMISQKIVSL